MEWEGGKWSTEVSIPGRSSREREKKLFWSIVLEPVSKDNGLISK